MCQNCGCRNTGFDYTKSYSAEQFNSQGYSLFGDVVITCRPPTTANPTGGGAMATYTDPFTGQKDKRKYGSYESLLDIFKGANIIDNRTSDCGGEGEPPEKEKLILSCSKSKTNVKGTYEDGRVQYAKYDDWMSDTYLVNKYDIVDNTTSDCRASSPSSSSSDSNEEFTTKSDNNMIIGLAVAGGVILVTTLFLMRR